MTGDPGFAYELLSDEQRADIIDQRLAQYEAEHYSTRLNRMTLEHASDVSDAAKHDQLAQMDRVLASLESSIAIHRAERAKLAVGGNGASAGG